MADEHLAHRRRRARQRRRRRAGVVGLAVVLVAAGACTAWAMRGGPGPSYRLASATRANVSQTVDADGTLTARRTAVLAFASAGTVDAIDVAVGDTVRAGQPVAAIDDSELRAAVTSAQSTLARAEQKLADDEDAQAAGTTVSTTRTGTTSATNGTGTNGTGTNGTGTNDAGYVRLTSAASRTPTTSSDVPTAQRAVVAAQHALDAAVTAQDSAVKTLVRQCAASDDSAPMTSRATADSGGTVTGSAGSQAVVVTLRDPGGDVVTTPSTNPQRVAAGGIYGFSGLAAGVSYTVEIARSAVLNTAACSTAVTAVSSGQRDVDTTHAALGRALDALTRAVAALQSGYPTRNPTGNSSGSTGGTGTRPSTSSPGSTTRGTGASGSGTNGTTGGSTTTRTTGASTGTTVTAELIAADAKSIDAAKAALAVADANRSTATLTAPIAGKVAAVNVATGDTVSAHSTSSTITVVGTGALSVDLDIGLSDIDLVKVGQRAQVTVDGHSDALPGSVEYVGLTNSASSTGSSPTYQVTVQLAHASTSLYDGMGASVAIDVGTATGVTAVPISALHATGGRHTVDVYTGGKTVTTFVTLGVVGQELVQIKSGLRAGERVVLADLSAAVPTSTTTLRGNRTGSGSLSGLTGTGQGGRQGGGPPGGR